MLCWSAKTVCYAATERAEKKKSFTHTKNGPISQGSHLNNMAVFLPFLRGSKGFHIVTESVHAWVPL